MIDKLIIIPKQRFPQQEEFRFQRIANVRRRLRKSRSKQ